jgi:hypothetical protein
MGNPFDEIRSRIQIALAEREHEAQRAAARETLERYRSSRRELGFPDDGARLQFDEFERPDEEKKRKPRGEIHIGLAQFEPVGTPHTDDDYYRRHPEVPRPGTGGRR